MPSSERLQSSSDLEHRRRRLLPRLSNFKCKQSHDERYYHENSLSLRLTGCIIIHETTNVKDCSSQVWDRYGCLVDPNHLASRDPTIGLIPSVLDSIGVPFCPESVLPVGTGAGRIDPNHPIYDKIVGRWRVWSEDNDRPFGYCH